ncbi:MAG: hypothetical protein Q4B73_07865 [Lachnospiraceae bacterium]|nr:hypothetical protein [Lachnospiraceae bacterium]
MDIYDMLQAMKKKALREPEAMAAILATKQDAQPIAAFCTLAREWGHPLYEMDLISYGEDAYAAMRRSTNGGGENSPALPCEEDYYELFIAELENAAR